jgi:hypothetical protein
MFTIVSCMNDPKGSDVANEEVPIEYKIGSKLKDWACYDINEDRICIPSTWTIKKQSKFHFFSLLDATDANSYFVVLKYNKTISGLNIDSYIKETYNQSIKDSIELFTGYTLKKIIFKDKQSVYGEYFTSIKGKPYMTYSTVFEIDDNLFELALKVDSAKAANYKEPYKDILFNFQHNDASVFSPKDEITNIKVIDFGSVSK